MRLATIGLTPGVLVDFSKSRSLEDSRNRFTPGAVVHAAPTDGVDLGAGVPNWGQSELMFVRYTGAAAILPGRLVTFDKDFAIADLANTANLGRAVCVTLSHFQAGDVDTQYGWVLLSGVAPVQYAVAATTGALFIGGAGQATPTPAAGKQLLNATCLIAAATAFTRQGKTQNGSKKVEVSRVNGIFTNQTVSGTGVPASTEVDSIDQSGNAFLMNNAATATGSVTLTFTPTGYGIVHFSRMFAQGQIT